VWEIALRGYAWRERAAIHTSDFLYVWRVVSLVQALGSEGVQAVGEAEKNVVGVDVW
jgi:hypothetical protein